MNKYPTLTQIAESQILLAYPTVSTIRQAPDFRTYYSSEDSNSYADSAEQLTPSQFCERNFIFYLLVLESEES